MIDKPQLFYPAVSSLPDRIRNTSNAVVREATDNDYTTYTTETRLVIDTRRNNASTKISHIYVVGEGITGYQINNSPAIVRTIPATVTSNSGRSISTTRFGKLWDLWELGTTLFQSSVDISFSGSNIRIYKILLLELGYTLNETLPPRHSKIDRITTLHKDSDSYATRSKRRKTKRWTWKSTYKLIFEDDSYDEFLFWLQLNPNMVFSQGYTNTPNRVYPATTTLKQFDAEPRGPNPNDGSLLTFVIEERTGIDTQQVTSQTNDPLHTPTRLSVENRDRSLRITWQISSVFPPLQRQEIRIATHRSDLASAPWTHIAKDATEHIFRNLENGRTYYIEVRGVSSLGNGNAASVSGTPNPIPAVPSAPTLTLRAGNKQITAQWTPPSAFPVLSKQQIRYAENQAGLAAATWTNLTADATSYTIPRLDNGTTYYVQVRGVNAQGNGEISVTASATPQAIPAIPDAPLNVTTVSKNEALQVRWQIPDVFPAITRQEIRWATSQSGLSSATWTDIKSTTVRNHTIPNLNNGTTYYVQVRLVNDQGNGTPSTAVSGTPNPIPAVPDTPTGLALTAGHKEIVATWTIGNAFPALSKQQIRWATSKTALASATWTDLTATAVRHVIPNLLNGTTYYVQVRGVNSQGNGTVSTTQSATPQGIPDAPTSVSLEPANMQLIASWVIGDAFPALQKQQIRWATSKTALATASWTDLTATATSYTISSLVNSKTYYVQVRGVNAEGDGVISDTESGVPAELVIPTAPTNLRLVSRNGANASIAWDASTGIPAVTHYEYRVRSVLRHSGRDYLPRTHKNWTSTGDADTETTIALDTRTSGATTLVNIIDVRAVNTAGTSPASGTLEI